MIILPITTISGVGYEPIILQMIIDVELTHMIWAGVAAIIGFFLTRELHKIYEANKEVRAELKEVRTDLRIIDNKVDQNTIDIARLQEKVDKNA